MNNRLSQVIKYKTGGKQTEFATLMGWSPQYLAKLLKGDNFGMSPVLTMIEKLPEINARWFLTGEGDMIEHQKIAEMQKTILTNILSVLDAEKYMPVMTADELYNFEQIVIGGKQPVISPSLRAKWQSLLNEREEAINAKFAKATAKSDRICKHQTVSK